MGKNVNNSDSSGENFCKSSLKVAYLICQAIVFKNYSHVFMRNQHL